MPHRTGRLVTIVAVLWMITGDIASADGAWKSVTEQGWDPSKRELVRRTYRVWDFHPELDLEFNWGVPWGSTLTPNGIVNGTGKLTWRKKGTPEYERGGLYSEYNGEMKNGRPDGQGSITMRSGLSYSGAWKNGLMNGRGKLKFDNGDDYDGELADGKLNGHGRYASTDGSIFDGAFKNGERDGSGILTLATGESYRTTWREGTEISREVIDAQQGASQAGADAATPGQRTNQLSIRISIDRKKNQDFSFNNDCAEICYYYESNPTPNSLQIQLGSKRIMSVWKGDRIIEPLPASSGRDGFIYDGTQFAPVYLLADLINGADRPSTIVAAYLNIAESSTDLEPYLWVDRPDNTCAEFKFDPTVGFRNVGWGPISGAKLRYSFGRKSSQPKVFSASLGTFNHRMDASVEDGLRALAMNLQRIATAKFSCTSYADLPNCLRRIDASGVLGELKGQIVMDDNVATVEMSGFLDYEWTSSDGRNNQRSSPVSLKMPLFVISGLKTSAECGGPGEVDHGGRTLDLSLDRRSYRLPLNWHAAVAPRANERFGITLVAPKSSNHQLQLVLELNDGSKVMSQKIDLSYFKPRLTKEDGSR
jgi:hypothetical protein